MNNQPINSSYHELYWAMQSCSAAYFEMGQHELGEAILVELIEITTKERGPASLDCINQRLRLEERMRKRGNTEKADAVHMETERLMEEHEQNQDIGVL
jgi:hypothetical protein